MAQAVHAASEYQSKFSDWANGTVIILEIHPKGVLESIQKGAIGYTDPYYGYPRAAAFTSIDFDTQSLPLAR
jgi:hypothetical protein